MSGARLLTPTRHEHRFSMATTLPAHRAAIVNLYTALFNRAPDASGLGFWAQAHANGASLATITQSFLVTTEGRATYPAAQTSAQFVAAFYQTVFGRAADASGLAFWTAALDAAGGAESDAARALLVGQIIGIVGQPLADRPDGLSDAAYAQTVADRALFGNKAEVGDYVVGLNIDDVGLARQVLALVSAEPASVPIAKAFADNRGVVPTPPSLPAPIFTIDPSGSAADLAARFAAYTGINAAVDVTGMDAAKLAEVARAIGKIANGGVAGTLTLDVPGYASADVATIATRFAAGVTLSVTGSASLDTIALKEFHRATTIDGGAGNDIFDVTVDGTAPTDTTISAHHTIMGGAGTMDLLRISAKGGAGDLLNGATVSGVEFVSIAQAGGTAQLSATTEMAQIGVGGRGALTLNNLDTTVFVLDGTRSTSNYTLNTVGTTATMALITNAQANTVAVNGSATTFNLNRSDGHVISSLKLADGISQLNITGSSDLGIVSLSGNATGELSIAVSGAGNIIFTTIDSPVKTFDASGTTDMMAVLFSQAVERVNGGSGSDTTVLSTAPAGGGGTTLTGGAGADIFALTAGIAQTATITLASLEARMVTITDLSVGDVISVGTPVLPSTGTDTPLQTFSGTGADLHAQTANVAAQMQALPTKIPYGAFTFGGASYILVDNALNGLGAGDMLIRLTGSPDLTRVVYTDSDLTMT
jgi:hypothetical protein